MLALLAACSRAPRAKAPTPRLPEPKARVRTPPPPAEWFWEPVVAELRPAGRPKAMELPAVEVHREGGAAKLWDELPKEAQERLKKEAILVVGPESDRSIGETYTELQAQKVPSVVTMDALVWLVHLGLERALAELDETELAPALHALLEKLDARLAKEETGAGTELAQGYRVAHGIVAVARALETPGLVTTGVVADERARIEAHAGPAASPLLGVTLDYATFAPPKAAGRPGSYRALAWLATAPLGLVARTEVPRAPIDVTRARTNTRAAMLLARVCDRDIDAANHATYQRILRVLAFVWGSPDDLSLTELDDAADAVGVDLTKPANIANVVRIDKVRARAATGRLPALSDGTPATVGVRLFGGHAAPDAIALQGLAGKDLPALADLGAWFARAEAGAALHASVTGSLLEALESWARTNDAAGFPEETELDHRGGWGLSRTTSVERARADSVLAGWTLLRASGEPFSRPKPVTTPAKELHVTSAAAVFVEPLPDAIARLVAATRQLRKGLGSRLAQGSAAMATLAEIEDVLKAAQVAAERHASDEAMTESPLLATFAGRLARLEAEVPHDPVTVPVFAGPKRRLLATAGKTERLLALARDPTRSEPVLVAGAHLSAQELVEAGGKRTPAARAAWMASFRWSR